MTPAKKLRKIAREIETVKDVSRFYGIIDRLNAIANRTEWKDPSEELPETNAHLDEENGQWIDNTIEVMAYFQSSRGQCLETVTFYDYPGCDWVEQACTWHTHWGDVFEEVEPTH